MKLITIVFVDWRCSISICYIRTTRELGVELMVLDDGWFGERDDDTTSLGDWFENRRKLPNGLKGVADRIEALGMKFGLWVEPEMISEKSKLYEKHPDWCIHVKGRLRSEGRSQLISVKGDVLMQIGISVKMPSDFESIVYILNKK